MVPIATWSLENNDKPNLKHLSKRIMDFQETEFYQFWNILEKREKRYLSFWKTINYYKIKTMKL
jgi:hypothetical protein